MFYDIIERARRTVNTSSARSVDHTPELLLPEEGPRSLGASKSAMQVNFRDLVPFLVTEVLEAKPT